MCEQTISQYSHIVRMAPNFSLLAVKRMLFMKIKLLALKHKLLAHKLRMLAHTAQTASPKAQLVSFELSC